MKTKNTNHKSLLGKLISFSSQLLALSFFLFLSACRPEIPLFADYKEIPVVYGFLDINADTNFIKITRAFGSSNSDPIDPEEVALIYDSSYYPGKLNAYIEELKSFQGDSYQPTGRKIILDTITIHHKEAGAFYSPHQLLYYTTEQFNTNEGDIKYRYKLNVVIPNGDTITAETGIVSGDIGVSSMMVTFQSEPSSMMSGLMFTSSDEATLYEIVMQFSYLESHPGQPLTPKEVSWSYGIKRITEYEKVANTTNCYRLYYDVNTLFNTMSRAIGNDTVWDVNHPNVTRYMGDFVVYISAAGKDFGHYYNSTQPSISLAPDYTNVHGGYGLFSSRILVSTVVGLSSRTQYDLFCEPWGFQER